MMGRGVFPSRRLVLTSKPAQSNCLGSIVPCQLGFPVEKLWFNVEDSRRRKKQQSDGQKQVPQDLVNMRSSWFPALCVGGEGEIVK